jgi:hypothetical protein
VRAAKNVNTKFNYTASDFPKRRFRHRDHRRWFAER